MPVIRKRGNPVPTFKELRYNASLILGNSHVSIGRATRLPPSYKSVGGYHISSETKPLPAVFIAYFIFQFHAVFHTFSRVGRAENMGT